MAQVSKVSSVHWRTGHWSPSIRAVKESQSSLSNFVHRETSWERLLPSSASATLRLSAASLMLFHVSKRKDKDPSKEGNR